MIRFFLKNGIRRSISFTLILLLLSEIIFPTVTFALTGGPSQPEVQSFEPVSTSDMVDVFSGDFKYNIPLLDVEGYPINIAYASGISVDQEASWVGLGWNLNVGAVNRAMRGLPDDFKGDEVKKEQNMSPNRTYGINAGIDFEIFGKESKNSPGGAKGKKFALKPSAGIGINYNNYTGFGVDLSIGVGISAGVGGKGKLDAGLGLHSSATEGLDISPNISYSNRTSKTDENDKTLANVSTASGSFGGTFNTRAGVKQLSFSGGFTKSVEKTTTHAVYNPFFLETGGSPIAIVKDVSITGKSRSAAGSVNFGLQSYVPSISMPMVNNSVALSLKFSTHLFGADADVALGGFYSSQKLAEKQKSVPSYGYLYSEYGQDNSNAMMDFNREKDGSFSRTTKNLPITNFTYDVFNVTGQGMGGAFRTFRGDVGHVFDNSASSISDSYSLGAELGGGNLFKAGLTISVVDVTSTSGKWVNDNGALEYFRFKQAGLNTPLHYEPSYFKQVGEMSVNDANVSLYNSLKGDEAYGIRIQQGASNNANALNSNLPNIKSKKDLERFSYDNTAPVSLNPLNNYISTRQKRNQLFVTLTKKEASDFGLQKNLYDNSAGVPSTSDPSNYMKLTTSAQDHHIAEISVINPDGARYFYGLPVYNLKNKEVSFNISQNTVDSTSGLVQYNASDASMDNSRGKDNSYNMTETPSYAYSYLLTSIVSPDYVDVNGNGPDNEDIGTFTKFHYTKPGGLSSVYKWRMPLHSSAGYANFNENSKSNDDDNSANYTYGEKELWFLDEIETKNFIAKFVLSDRKDAYGVTDEMGGLDFSNPAHQKKLDKIILYSKPEYLANPNTAVPIKTVYFEYNYDLCGGIPNNSGGALTPNETSNNGGKLTLKKVYFTYGKSNRAVFNQYQFSYGSNPGYHNKAYDRWGNYKPVNGVIDYGYSALNLTNSEFPYTEQNKANADIYSGSWCLNQIDLPTGGQINIQYESDDYAFVQNMPAGQMFKVVGFNTNLNTPPAINDPVVNTLYNGLNAGYSYMVVDLQSITTATSDAEFKKYYLKDISDGNKQLYFRFLTNLTNSTTNQTQQNFYEYVSGYADIESSNGQAQGGLIYNGNVPSGLAWIKIKQVNVKNKGTSPTTNPIAMAAIQFARINYGNVVWDTPYNPPGDIEEALKQLAQAAKSSLKTLVTGFKNPNKALIDKNYCKEFVPAKSMVRLYNPDGDKLGGGSRVKNITLSDNWSSMTGGQANSTYGQEYTYTDTDESGRTISSGVASYEPMIGGDENSLKQPYYLGKNKWALLAPDDRYYIEGPLGESFFPSPTIGYSKVKVQSIVPNNVPTNGRNGYKVYEFYTAKDYPTICRHTPIMPKQYRSPLKTLVKISSKDLISASQGYVVITNDMHGKAKAEFDYAEGKLSPEKETRFYYKTKDGYQTPSQRGLYSDASYSGNQLDNTCTIIKKDNSIIPGTGTVGGAVWTSMIGVDFDAVADFRESETETNMVSSQNNAATFLVGLIPALVPTVWPGMQHELTRFRSAVLTKVVNQYGIIDRTEVKTDQSLVTSENLAFDAETGEAIVSKTTNDFNDPVYNLKYPAHWGYKFMGGAYSNTGLSLAASWQGTNYLLQGSGYLDRGDELALTSGNTKQRVWVCNSSGSTVNLMDENGNPVTLPNVTLKVIRSAKRNIINSEMEAITCLNNPLPQNLNNGDPLNDPATLKILDAKATVFSDKWQLPRGYLNSDAGDNCSCTISPTGGALLNNLEGLFNNFGNGSMNQNGFFNYAVPAVPFNGITTFIVAYQTAMWKDPSVTAGTPYAPVSNITSGFGTPNNYPDYVNYNFTQSLLPYLPFRYPSPYNPLNGPGLGYAPYVSWLGPAPNTPFNTSDQIVGAFVTDGFVDQAQSPPAPSDFNYCHVAIEFPGLTTSLKSQLIGYFGQLPSYSGGPGAYFIDLVPLANQTSCSMNELKVEFRVIAQNGGAIVFTYPQTVNLKTSCFLGALSSCTGGLPGFNAQCGKLENDQVNPYFVGISGNWRTKANYTFLTDRTQVISNPQLNLTSRTNGYYTTFKPIYGYSVSTQNWDFGPSSIFSGADRWVSTVETTKYNQFGVEIETKDALGRYSSALYGYNESYPVAVASNARLQEIAYDGFEDYAFYYNTCKREHHFDFYAYQAYLNTNEAHTGTYSLRVIPGNTFTTNKTVVNTLCSPLPGSPNPPSPIYPCSYSLKCYDFIEPFKPYSFVGAGPSSTPVDYVISYWVKEGYAGTRPLDYANHQVTVTQGGGPAFAIKDFKRSPVIDGWQRIEYTFTIPAGYSGPLSVNLINNNTSDIYFDDVRMHPDKSNMKAYVYHPVTLKYVAELDANNFATFYEYDEQGNLVRVKKETERGIMTLKESKTHYLKP